MCPGFWDDLYHGPVLCDPQCSCVLSWWMMTRLINNVWFFFLVMVKRPFHFCIAFLFSSSGVQMLNIDPCVCIDCLCECAKIHTKGFSKWTNSQHQGGGIMWLTNNIAFMLFCFMFVYLILLLDLFLLRSYGLFFNF